MFIASLCFVSANLSLIRSKEGQHGAFSAQLQFRNDTLLSDDYKQVK